MFPHRYLLLLAGFLGAFSFIAVTLGDERTTVANADRALETPLLSVAQSPVKAPSGNPHDYVSLSTYAWPNPASPDGLPYILRDGQTNPETGQYPDRKNLEHLITAVRQLVNGYRLRNDERYAKKALALLENWFLGKETRMNPNLTYAQIVPGKNRGLGNASGLIETHNFVDLIHSITMLEASYPVPGRTRAGMRQWFEKYQAWLQYSPIGKAGEKARNNQLTWLTAQKAAIAEFLDEPDVARNILEKFIDDHLPEQIAADGAQTEELKRTKSFNYSLVNLQGLFALARLADEIHMDLWHYRTPGGAGLEKAIDFLVPYATGQETWPYKEIHPYDPALMKSVLSTAIRAYPDKRDLYESSLSRLRIF